jgi:hypothetical protein
MKATISGCRSRIAKAPMTAAISSNAATSWKGWSKVMPSR